MVLVGAMRVVSGCGGGGVVSNGVERGRGWQAKRAGVPPCNLGFLELKQ